MLVSHSSTGGQVKYPLLIDLSFLLNADDTTSAIFFHNKSAGSLGVESLYRLVLFAMRASIAAWKSR